MIQEYGKLIIATGFVLVFVGGVLMTIGKIPFLGKLPGDVVVKKGNFTLYAPFASSIVLSIILTFVIAMISRWKGG